MRIASNPLSFQTRFPKVDQHTGGLFHISVIGQHLRLLEGNDFKARFVGYHGSDQLLKTYQTSPPILCLVYKHDPREVIKYCTSKPISKSRNVWNITFIYKPRALCLKFSWPCWARKLDVHNRVVYINRHFNITYFNPSFLWWSVDNIF